MKTFQLRTSSSFIDPGWLRSMGAGPAEAVVAADGTVAVRGEQLVFRDRAQAPQPGTELCVWVSRWIECATAEEWRQAQREREEAALREREHQRRQEEARQARAQAFNARIDLPVRWEPGIKDVLSGLSARSSGNGCSRATVVHVLLREPLQAGRLVRQAGDFLCTTAAGDNGKRWSGDPGLGLDGHDHAAAVSCKACLRLAAPWMREAEQAPQDDFPERSQRTERMR
jgi:hypothetical protein